MVTLCRNGLSAKRYRKILDYFSVNKNISRYHRVCCLKQAIRPHWLKYSSVGDTFHGGGVYLLLALLQHCQMSS